MSAVYYNVIIDNDYHFYLGWIMNFKLPIVLFLFVFLFPASLLAEQALDDLQKANEYVVKAIQFAEQNDLTRAKEQYDIYNKEWYRLEEGGLMYGQ